MQGRIIFLMNGWNSSAGGIQTVNREIVSAISALYPGISCTLVVPLATQREIEDAFTRGVEIIQGTRADDWSGALLSAQLSKIDAADVLAVVGHSHFSGRVAQELRDRFYPKALSVQFVHTSPLHVEGLKEYKQTSYVKDRESKVAEELEIAARADLIVCIGPRLHRSMHDLIVARKKPAAAIRSINCGVSRPSEMIRCEPMRPTLLCVGRTESMAVKGLDVFAYAAGYLLEGWTRHPATRERQPPQFVIRGVKDNAEEFERRLASLAEAAGCTNASFFARPYTESRDDLATDYRGATAFLMPSREEGFGLVACEALSHGVPILVSEESGIAEVIKKAASEHHMDVSKCIISMAGDAKTIARRFADAALEVLIHGERANSYANMLLERLLPICSWEVGARQFVAAVSDALGTGSHATVRDSKPLSSTPDAQSRAQVVLNEHRDGWNGLPGVVSVSVRESIVLTFEKGCVPHDLPPEIDGVPLVVREGAPIQATAAGRTEFGVVLVDGKPTASTAIITTGAGGNVFALTVAHAIEGAEGKRIEVRIGTEIVTARKQKVVAEADWALLALPDTIPAPEQERISDASPNQSVMLRTPDRSIGGTVLAVQASASVQTAAGIRRNYEGLFEISTAAPVIPGFSGAPVISANGEVIGMLVAASHGAGPESNRAYALPIRPILRDLEKLVGKATFSRPMPRIAIMPTSEVTLHNLLRSCENVERTTQQGRTYYECRLPFSGPPLTIAPVPRFGNIAAAATTMGLIIDRGITDIFVVGLCGGLRRSQQSVGDVVVASDVIYYEPGVLGPEGQRQRARVSGMTSARILRVVEELARENESAKGRFAVHIGTVASGEKVVRNSNVFAEGLSQWPNLVAVDMESAGVFETVALSGQDISVTVIRGIADFADARMEDSVRMAVSSNAIKLTLDLIADFVRRSADC